MSLARKNMSLARQTEHVTGQTEHVTGQTMHDDQDLMRSATRLFQSKLVPGFPLKNVHVSCPAYRDALVPLQMFMYPVLLTEML